MRFVPIFGVAANIPGAVFRYIELLDFQIEVTVYDSGAGNGVVVHVDFETLVRIRHVPDCGFANSMGSCRFLCSGRIGTRRYRYRLRHGFDFHFEQCLRYASCSDEYRLGRHHPRSLRREVVRSGGSALNTYLQVASASAARVAGPIKNTFAPGTTEWNPFASAVDTTHRTLPVWSSLSPANAQAASNPIETTRLESVSLITPPSARRG